MTSASRRAIDFIKWFASDEIQQKWAEVGGYTCNKAALASDAFLNGTPYNQSFAETMGFVKDFYNIPEYGLLLPPAQTALSQYVVEGKGTAKEALDTVAAEHQKILEDAGYKPSGTGATSGAGAPTSCAAAAMPEVDKTKLEGIDELTIWWAQWDPADYLQEIGNLFEQETGVKVNVVQEPWGSYQNKVSAEWAARGTGFDMVVGDSQWIGQGVTEGHYVDMTDFMVSNGLDKTVTEATLKYYGEYPPGSGKYYAYPTEGDANGWAYRKDIVENPDEMKAFEAKYGYAYSHPAQRLQDVRRHGRVLPPARRQPAHVRRGRLHPEGLRRHHHGLPERPLHLRLRLEQGLAGRRRPERPEVRRGPRSLQEAL